MVILVRYAEIALKSRYVRNELEKALIRNLESKLIKNKIQAKIERDRGHIYITSDREEEVMSQISRTFGVVSFSPCVRCSTDINDIERNVVDVVAEMLGSKKTFAIRARRAGEFGFTSIELAKKLGSAVLARFPQLTVDLNEPELEIHVEVRCGGTYIYTAKLRGPGGLPYGTQGKVVALLETEEDVVAAWLMMKRGCALVVVGFKPELWEPLENWNSIKCETTAPIMENAIKIAKKRKAQGIVSGMTPEKLIEVLPNPTEFPVFLPLVGMDRETIKKLKVVIGVGEK